MEKINKLKIGSTTYEVGGTDQADKTQISTNKNDITALKSSNTQIVNDIADLKTGKQNTLTAGTNITIENNVISAVGGGGITFEEIVSAKIINFTIGNQPYQAEEGMTWGQWVDSEYNIGKDYKNGFYSPNTIARAGAGDSYYQVELNGVFVTPNDKIIEGNKYSIHQIGGGSN